MRGRELPLPLVVIRRLAVRISEWTLTATTGGSTWIGNRVWLLDIGKRVFPVSWNEPNEELGFEKANNLERFLGDAHHWLTHR